MFDELEGATKQAETLGRLMAVYWAGVLIWAGLVFGAESLGWLPQVGSADTWSWVFLGAGLYALVGAILRLTMPGWPNPTTWDYVWAGGLLIVGIGGFTAVPITWPLVLIFVGLVSLGGVLLRRS